MTIINNQIIDTTLFISINNIKTKNSMIPGFHDEIQSSIKRGEEDVSISSIIIYGEGNFFCAGGDLNSLKKRRDMSVEERRKTLNQLNKTILSIRECSKPTIAAVEGGAAGAGVSLAMACDFLIMADNAFFSLAYVKIGLTPDGGVTKLLAEVLPKQVLSEMSLLGDRIFADQLNKYGMINMLTEKNFVKNKAIEFSKKFENSPCNSMKRIKALNREAYKNNFLDQMNLEAELMVESQGDKESVEGIDSFLEKRDVNFKKLREK